MRVLAVAVVLVATVCTGCASVTQGMTHSLRMETVTDKGELVAGADCTLRNVKGRPGSFFCIDESAELVRFGAD